MVYEEKNLNPFMGEDDDAGGIEELLDDDGTEGDGDDNIEEGSEEGEDEEDTSL
jgi:hypothetical protein